MGKRAIVLRTSFDFTDEVHLLEETNPQGEVKEKRVSRSRYSSRRVTGENAS